MNTTEAIEKWLESSIETDELAQLQAKLVLSRELRREYALRKEVNELAQEDAVLQLRLKLQLARKMNQRLIGETDSSSTKKLFYAAATLAGITIGGWAAFHQGNAGVSPIDLYKENFAPYPSIHLYRESEQVATNEQLIKSQILYSSSHYSEASKIFEELLIENPNSPTLKFYLGVTYLHLNNIQNSRKLLTEIASSESIFSTQAYWYLGLGYLAENKVDDAIQAFTKVKDSGG
jgi:predicted Zn-dependent protease